MFGFLARRGSGVAELERDQGCHEQDRTVRNDPSDRHVNPRESDCGTYTESDALFLPSLSEAS
jgi:hypothetical protein